MALRAAVRRADRRTERGTAALEFALVLGPLLMLVFGVVQYGMLLYSTQGANDVARDAARKAAVGTPVACTDFVSAVRSEVGSLSRESSSSATVTRSYSDGAVDVGDEVSVTVRFKSYNFHFPFIPVADDGAVAASAKARVEYVDGSQPEPVSCP